MVGILETPFLWVVATIALYGVAYWGYGKWIDRNVWRSDAKKATPAHMYMDGVEYFPVSRYVLWGYQFKSVAALGPILGPFIGVTFGWLPALIWIIGGNFFIGWLQDYGSMMLSVRKEGRSFGPITYEFTGARGRTNLLAFVLFYLVIISAAFIALIATFWNSFKGTTFVPTIGILLTGLLCGQLLYRVKMNVFAVTVIGLALVGLSLYLGPIFPVVLPFGLWNIAAWAGICVLILYLAAVLPTPTFIQPTNYIAFYPAFAAIILILVGALATPFTIGASPPVGIQLDMGPFLTDPQGVLGPIWPILFVAIACGAISGWHSLVSSSSSAKQLDIETDALPVGGGAMLSEGLLALASLIAYMVLTKSFVFGVAGDATNPPHTNTASWPVGAALLVSRIIGVSATNVLLTTFFGLVLVIYALTVQALVTRFFRLVAAETWSEGRFRIFGNKHVSTVVGLGVPWVFAVSGSWWALWLYFGGANQLLAGLAIMLISIHLARVRAPTKYSLIPGVFMVVTTLAALVWQTWTFLYSVWLFLQGDKSWIVRNVRGPIQADPNYILVAVGINAVFVLIGVVLFGVGLSMSIRLFRSYRSSVVEARGRAPAAADGGTRER